MASRVVASLSEMDDHYASLQGPWSVVQTETPADAVMQTPGCVLLDAADEWRGAVREIRDLSPSLPILLTGTVDREALVDASRLGVEVASATDLARRGETLTDRIDAALDTPGSLSESPRDVLDADRQLELYRAVHESIEESVCVFDRHGQIRLATDRLTGVLGEARDGLVGQSVLSYLSIEAATDGERAVRSLVDAPAGTSRSYETTLEHSDDTSVPVEIELSLLPDGAPFDGAVAVVRDRSELEAERRRFAQLFDEAPDAVVDTVLTDDGPRIRRVNPAFERAFGRSNDEVTDQPLAEAIAPEECGEQTPIAPREFKTGETVELERRTEDGTHTFLFRAVTYGESEEGTLAFGIFTDITERRDDERRIRVMNRIFRHDLANTNGIVRGYLELLSNRLDGEPMVFAENALEATERVTNIAETVHDIERALGGADTTTASNLATLTADAVEAARETNSGASFTDTTPSVTVPGGRLLSRAVEEIVENAAVHAGATPTVEVGGTATPTDVTLRVSDDGDGVPELERAVITGEVEITQLDHSRGLGLWLATYVCRSLGGYIGFEDEGRTVTLTLPRAD